jgi:uncharacterized membrane protein
MSTATHSIDVNADTERAYVTWRDFENWPKFMPALKEAIDTGDRTAVCKIATPVGTVECHTAIINEHVGESFQWHTTSGDVDFLGKVTFEAAGENTTRITVAMEYHAPLGKVGEALARWLHEDPCAELPAELEKFKQLVEAGEGASA